MKRFTLTSNKLKIIAVIAMVFDHFIGGFIPAYDIYSIILRIPGRIAAPIMCFMIAEGYKHTHNVKKYILRLFIFSLISHIPYNLYFGLRFFQATSVMWSLFLGLLALTIVKSDKYNVIIKAAAVLVCCFLSIRANWNYLAVLWIVAFGVFNGNFKKQAFSLILIGLIEIIPVYLGVGPVIESCPHFYRFGIYLALPILYLYNGEKGRSSTFLSKFFYYFYPLHLVLLYIFKMLWTK
jgi:hypothetical protein